MVGLSFHTSTCPIFSFQIWAWPVKGDKGERIERWAYEGLGGYWWEKPIVVEKKLDGFPISTK